MRAVDDSAIVPSDLRRGTRVRLEMVSGRVPKLEDLFAAYTAPRDAAMHAHMRHHQARDARVGADIAIRSQASLLARLTEFRVVALDFSGVEVVGQGFCDEVFRVFGHAHPEVALEPIGMSDTIAFTVARAGAAAA